MNANDMARLIRLRMEGQEYGVGDRHCLGHPIVQIRECQMPERDGTLVRMYLTDGAEFEVTVNKLK